MNSVDITNYIIPLGHRPLLCFSFSHSLVLRLGPPLLFIPPSPFPASTTSSSLQTLLDNEGPITIRDLTIRPHTLISTPSLCVWTIS
jgi:hypothetical protein